MNELVGNVVVLDSVRKHKGLTETPLQRNKRLAPGLDPKLVEQVFDRAHRVGSEKAYQMIEHGPLEMRATIWVVSNRLVSNGKF